MVNFEDHLEPIYNNYYEAVTEYFNNKFEAVNEFTNTAYRLLGLVCICLILIIKSYRKLKEIYQDFKDYFLNGHNPLNQNQNEGNRGEGDGHSGVASETSGHANNMLVDGTDIIVENSAGVSSSKNCGGANNMLVDRTDIKVENSAGATSSKNSGGANNMLIDGTHIKVENSAEATTSKNSGGANNMLVDGRNINIRNSGGGSDSNNSGGANNVVIKGQNIKVGDSRGGSSSNNSASAINLVIKGKNINLKDDGSGTGSNKSGGANNMVIKGSDINFGEDISKNSDANLRSIIIPEEMVEKFRDKTRSNSDKQLETSAILLGKQSKNEFIITHLLFLPQNENQNSCVTDIQEKLLAKQYELGLIELGWISTHSPMDSIDFHAHFDNHELMKEAIAIVVARDDDGIAIYDLTKLKFIANSRSSKIRVRNEKELLDKHPPNVKFDSLRVELMD